MKKLLIVETEYEGHYLTGYIKYILRAFKKEKIQIFLLLSENCIKYGKGALNILYSERVNFKVIILKTPNVDKSNFISLTIYQLKLFFLIKRKFIEINKVHQFNHVILTSIQRLDKIISIFGSPFENTEFSGVFLGLKFHLHEFNIQSTSTNHLLSRYLFKKLLSIKSLSKIIINDFLLKEYVDKNKWKNKKKVLFLHDPKEFNFYYSKNYALKKLGISKDKFVILVYGAIIDSKGVEELVKIYTHKKSEKVHCLIAGKHFGSTKKFLKNDKLIKKIKKKNLLSFYDNWQSEKREAMIFNACDAVWIGYKNYPFPSGVLYQAVALKKPAILSNKGFINELNRRYKIGIPVDIFNPKTILDAIDFIKENKNKIVLKKNLSTFLKVSKPTIWTKTIKEIFKELI